MSKKYRKNHQESEVQNCDHIHCCLYIVKKYTTAHQHITTIKFTQTLNMVAKNFMINCAILFLLALFFFVFLVYKFAKLREVDEGAFLGHRINWKQKDNIKAVLNSISLLDFQRQFKLDHRVETEKQFFFLKVTIITYNRSHIIYTI